MPDAAAPLLRAIDIHKRYGGAVALDGISIDVARGEFLTLLGPSGSGKTTFLMILAGFVEPTSGRLEEAGLDVTRRPAEARNYGMVFQGYALFPHMTVEENVAFPLVVRKVPAAERKRRVEAMIATVGLEAHRGKRPSQLSGGQQQRVALARALVFQPTVLLLDEPLSALDKNLREQMQGELQRLHREIGATFIFVTHDQTEALALSTRVAIFHHGKLQQIGAPETVYDRPANRFVAEFLGRINLLPLTDVGRDGGVLRGRFDGTAVAAPLQEGAGARGAVLAVRPEYMTVVRTPERDPLRNAIPAVVVGRTYTGATSLLQLRSTGGTPLSCEIPSANRDLASEPGAEIWIQWPLECGFVLAEEEPRTSTLREGRGL